MNEILKIFLSLSVSGSILALALFAVKPVIKNKFSKRWQYYIWLIVILRLLIPFSPEISIVGSMFNHLEGTSTAENIQPVGTDEHTSAGAPSDSTTESPAVAPKFLSDVKNNIWLLWIGVAVMLFVRKVTSYHSFVRYVKAGMHRIEDMELLEINRQVSSEMGLKHPLPVYTNQLVASPMLVGILRPTIIIPTVDIDDDELRNVFRHELTHHKRADIFYKWLTQTAVCLHWFNPLAYIISREISNVCEFSCDEAIINKLSNSEQLQYGDTLLSTLKTGGTYSDAIVSITMSESTQLVKERLEAIMIFKKKTGLTICMTALLTILLLCGFTFTGAYAVNRGIAPGAGQSLSDASPNGQATDYVIECATENVTIIQEGAEFKVEVDPQSEGNYQIRDNTNISMGDRHYRYNKWDVIFERTDRLDRTAVYSSSVTVTIPEGIGSLYIITSSGNIHAENLANVDLILETRDGEIYVAESATTGVNVSSRAKVQLINVTATDDIIINEQSYYGGAYMNGSDGRHTIILED